MWLPQPDVRPASAVSCASASRTESAWSAARIRLATVERSRSGNRSRTLRILCSWQRRPPGGRRRRAPPGVAPPPGQRKRRDPSDELSSYVRLQCTMAEVRRTYCDQCGHKSGFTRFCPQCGTPGTDRPYTPSALRPGYCPGCGEEYSTVTSEYCSVCGVPRSVSTPDNAEPHCRSCGRQIATASSEYCSHCGGKVLYR
jgi:ribosomal protein L37E